MKSARILLTLTTILAVAQVALALLGGRPSTTVPDGVLVTVEGRLTAFSGSTVTVALTRRRGLTAYLPSPAAQELTLALTPSTTVSALFTPRADLRDGPLVRRQILFSPQLVMGEPVVISAYPTAPGSRQLTADRITAIRVVPQPRVVPGAELPRRGSVPTPGDVR